MSVELQLYKMKLFPVEFQPPCKPIKFKKMKLFNYENLLRFLQPKTIQIITFLFKEGIDDLKLFYPTPSCKWIERIGPCFLLIFTEPVFRTYFFIRGCFSLNWTIKICLR